MNRSMQIRHMLGCLVLPLLALHGGVAGGQAIPTAGFPAPPAAPAGAPNVLIILTDDVGFASGSTFGGAIPTPTMDQLAANGLRYDNFHVNALCSPSRAALLTGRNAHAVGFGGVTDFGHGADGYNTVIPRSAATIGQILKANGYDTAWFGKNHLVPTWQSGPLGPFDQWASGLGFDYFYGFLGGLTDQFHPALVENNNTIEAPDRPDYILDRDLADHAIQWIRAQRAAGGGRPFLIHYTPGTAHGPLQAPADWIARFRGKFDAGWDVLRAEVSRAAEAARRHSRQCHARAAAAGRAQPGRASRRPEAALCPLHGGLCRAARLLRRPDRPDRRGVARDRPARQHDDRLHPGRQRRSPEGGIPARSTMRSTSTARAATRRRACSRRCARIDEIGGPRTYPVAPVGWAAAMNTPFPYYKTMSSRLGGITNGMVVSWPKGYYGARRAATVHPSRRRAADDPGSREPDRARPRRRGRAAAVRRRELRLFLRRAAAPSRHRTQYFEVTGNAAIYQDGWLAASPVSFGGLRGAPPALDSQWQLYDLRTTAARRSMSRRAIPDKLRNCVRCSMRRRCATTSCRLSGDTAQLLLARKPPGGAGPRRAAMS